MGTQIERFLIVLSVIGLVILNLGVVGLFYRDVFSLGVERPAEPEGKGWLSVIVSGKNQPTDCWFICITSLEKRFSDSLPQGKKYLNIFRNLNQLFQWTFAERAQYLLAYLTQFLLLRKFLQFRLKRRKFRQISKYLDSLAQRIKEYRINVQADPSLNFCRVLVSFDQPTPKELLLHVPKMNNFLYHSPDYERQLQSFLGDAGFDLDTPRARAFFADIRRLFSLTRLLSRHLCIELMKVLLFNIQLLVAEARKNLLFVSQSQMRFFYMAKLADKSALKFRFHSVETCDDETLGLLDSWLKFDWRKDMDCSFFILLVSNADPNRVFKLDPIQLTNREQLKQWIRGNLFNEIIFKKKTTLSAWGRLVRFLRLRLSLVQNWILRQTVFKYSGNMILFNLVLLLLLFLFEIMHFYFYISNYVEEDNPTLVLHALLFFYLGHQTVVSWMIIFEQLGIHFNFCSSSLRQFIHESNFFLLLLGSLYCVSLFFYPDHYEFFMPILFPSLLIFKMVRMNLLKTIYAMQNFKTLNLHLVKS